MILGILLGIVMPDWRGVLFGSFGAVAIRFGFFFASGGDMLLWNEIAAMAIASYAMCAFFGSVAYGIKRLLRPARAAG